MLLSCELQLNRITDVGTMGPMIDQIESSLDIKLNVIHADSAYASLMDLHVCKARNVELVAPVQANGLAKEKLATKNDKQLSHDLLQYDLARHTYTCPAGHPMPYLDRDNRTRATGILVMEKFRQHTELCQACPATRFLLFI